MTNQLYYTLDTSGTNADWAEQNADISPVPDNDLDALSRDLIASAFKHAECTIERWVEADWGDCWVKLYSEPELDDEGYITIDGIPCTVNAPGSHPGGRSWWCNPAVTVMMPVLKANEDL